MIDSFTQDVRYALRTMKANPAFTLVAVLSLALGIGANTAIFSLLDAVMLKYLPVQHPEELVQVKVGRVAVTNPVWEALRDRQDIFSSAFVWAPTRFNMAAGGESQFVNGLFVSGDFFRTLGVGAAIGRTLTAADDRRGCGNVAALSYGLWQERYGGDPAILGKTVQLDTHLFQIVGVTRPGFFGVDVGRFFGVAVPLCSEAVIRGGNSWLDHHRATWLGVMGRPKPGVSLQQVEARLKVLGPAVFEAADPPEDGRRPQRDLRSFAVERAGHGVSGIRSQYGGSLTILMAVAGLVLLIACANIASLLLARATARQQEIAIRLAIGAGRFRLIRQLLTESVLLASAGAAIGLLLANWSGRALLWLISTQGMQANLELAIDGRLLAFTAGVALLTGVLFGIAPAVRATGPAASLAFGRGFGRRDPFALGKALVALQIALSFVLVFGAALFLRTFENLLTQDAGFDRDNVLLINADVRNANYPADRKQSLFDALLARIAAVPGVRSASQSGMTPVSGIFWQMSIVVSSGLQDTVRCYFNSVSPRYFETMATPLLLGRDFDERDTATSARVAIVNETAARDVFGAAHPVGRTYRQGGVITEVIGVVKDAKYGSLRQPAPPTIYLPVSQRAFGARTPTGGLDSANFAVRSTGPAANLIPAMKQAMGAANRDVAIEFRVFSTQVKESLVQERLMATLSSFFGALALMLAVIGLYGLMSYTVGRWRGEIGIRTALGAERRDVLWMILRDVCMLVGLGVVLGAPAAVASARLVGSMLYAIAPGDSWTIATSAAVLLASAAVAGYVPARRAALVDPMAALREE